MADDKTPIESPTILNQPTVAPTPATEKLYDQTPNAPAPIVPATPDAPPAAPSAPAKPDAPAVPPVTPTPEPAKPAEPKPGEPPTTTEPAKPAASADYDLKLPEGSPLSAADLAATLKQAKAEGLTKEQAERTLGVQDASARNVLARQQEQVKTMQVAWKDQIAKDSEIGGDEFPKNMELAKRAWDKLASPELKKIADQTGLGNHPELVRLMVRIGRELGEDTLTRGTVGRSSGKRAPEDVLYGSPLPATAPLQ